MELGSGGLGGMTLLRFLRFVVGDDGMLRCLVLSSSSEMRRRLCSTSMLDATERYKGYGLGVNMAPSQTAEKAKQNAGQAAKMNLYNHWLLVIFNYFPP